MITGELSAALAIVVAAAVASGDPPFGGDLRAAPGLAAGTWRPVPPEAGGGPGTYATTLPFLLAHRLAADPERVAAVLAAALRPVPEETGTSDAGTSDAGTSDVRISKISVTGGGYLSITVTPDTLAGLAVGIVRAGQGCARSLAMYGARVTAPRDARLASARDWADARQRLTAEQAGRLAAAAGAQVTWVPPGPKETVPGETVPGETVPGETVPGETVPGETVPGETVPGETVPGETVPGETVPGETVPGETVSRGNGPVAEALAYAGEDSVRFALSRLVSRPVSGPVSGPPRPHGPGLDPRAMAAQHLGNPAYAVRYAHAHAASALRQAADLGLPEPDAERFQPRLLAHPSERVLLDAMSWLPERVAGAARRRQPHVVAAYLEDLAGRYFGWQEACPVMRPGSVPPRPPDLPPGGGQPPGGELTQARLQLASAARTALGTGLQLLGIAAPGRM